MTNEASDAAKKGPVKTRCPRCQAMLPPAVRKCVKCGAAVTDDEPLAEVTLARPAAPYASGDKVADRYLVLEAYGTGALGTTYRARDEGGQSVAVKVVPHALLPTSPERDAFVAALAQLKGRAMQRVALPLDAGVDAGGVVFVVSRWVWGASLRRVLRAYRAAERRLEPDQSLGVLQGVASALRELHMVSSHGALYPESIQITSDGVVLTDAAIASAIPPMRFVAHMEHHSEVLPYLAPEVRVGKRGNAGADLFGLGALAADLLFGDPMACSLAGVKLPNTPPELEEALRALVSAHPAKRAGALPHVLERLGREAGAGSLPAYAPLPSPAAAGEARTRKVRSMMGVTQEPVAIVPRAPLKK